MVRLFLLFAIFFPLLSIAGGEKDSTSSNKPRNIILPVAVATPETQFGLGVFAGKFFKMQRDSTIRTSNVQVVGLYTLKNQLLAQSGLTLYFPKERYIVNWYGSYTNWPDKFYGIGDNTKKSDVINYSYKQIYLNPQIVKRIYKRLFVGIQYEYQNVLDVQSTEGDLFDQQQVLGRDGSVSSGIGPVLLWDSRNGAFWPTKGTYFQASYKGYGNITGSEFNFSNYSFDFRKFVHTRGDNVFAFQALVQITSGHVPFRELPYLGGPYILRGYYLGRFRDKGMVAFQPEYRFNVWKRFGGVAFVGLGEVADKFNSLSFDGIKAGVGAGLRYALLPKDKLNIRVDGALGTDSFGFYFIVMEAF